MRKAYRLMLSFGCAVAMRALYQRILETGSRKTQPKTGEKVFTWRYGDIHYTESGKGQPLLLLHSPAPGANRDQFKDVIGTLSKRYHVFAPDLLGFGCSEKPNISYCAYLYVIMINDFIRSVIRQDVNAVGIRHSAAYLVMGATFEPSLYKKLMLLSPTGIHNHTRLPSAKDQFLKWTIQAPVLGAGVCNRLYDEIEKRERKRIARGDDRHAIASLFTHYLNVKIAGKLNQIKFPILIKDSDCLQTPAQLVDLCDAFF